MKLTKLIDQAADALHRYGDIEVDIEFRHADNLVVSDIHPAFTSFVNVTDEEVKTFIVSAFVGLADTV